MRALWGWAWVGLLLSSCHLWRAPGQAEAGPEPVTVRSLQAEFPQPERAQFSVRLDVHNERSRAGILTQVFWEVWLDGRFFASGTEQLSQPLPSEGTQSVSLQLPVLFKHLARSERSVPLELALRGHVRVSYGGDEQPLSFKAVRRMMVKGAPVWSAPD